MDKRSAYYGTKKFLSYERARFFQDGRSFGVRTSKFCLPFSLLDPTLFSVLGPVLLSVLGSTLSFDTYYIFCVRSYFIFCFRPYGDFYV